MKPVTGERMDLRVANGEVLRRARDDVLPHVVRLDGA